MSLAVDVAADDEGGGDWDDIGRALEQVQHGVAEGFDFFLGQKLHLVEFCDSFVDRGC